VEGLGDKSGILALTEALEDENMYVRKAARSAIAAIELRESKGERK